MKKNYKLKRLEEAYIYATRINERNQLIEFGKNALFHLEIEYGLLKKKMIMKFLKLILILSFIAIRIYRLAAVPDMVFALNSIKVNFFDNSFFFTIFVIKFYF